MRRWLMVFLLAASFAVGAQDAAKLDRYLASLDSLQADFSQTVFDEQGEVVQQAEGRMAMQRPGRFRWDYSQPYEQLIVADGERFWLYDKDLEQVTVRRMDQALSTAPLAVLSGAAPIEQEFSIENAFQRDGLQWYALKPKAEQSEFTRLSIAFAGEQLDTIELQDNFERRTRLKLVNLERNPKLAASLFQFTPPAGVDVIGE